jgi:drug/metabolite transporter (DMT)-like permease
MRLYTAWGREAMQPMKIVGYVLFGIGCFLVVVTYFVHESNHSNGVHDSVFNNLNGILIVALCIWAVSIFLVSIATIREQAAARAYRKAHPEPMWVSWKDLDIGEARAESKDRLGHPE